MTFLTAVRAEFARLTSSRMGTIALFALMTIPIVYGGLYLWGNADPYSSLDRVPAAIVVDDTGATIDGDERNLGRDAADAMIDDGTFGWVEVDADDAQAGVESGRFDFAVVFPADFSTDLASASGGSPKQADLGLITDDTNSYLSTTLAKQAAQSVRDSVTEKLGSAASLTLLDGVARLRDGLSDASDGAAALSDGAASARDGATSLADGTAQLSTGAAGLAGGAGTLVDGLGSLQTATSQLPAQASQLAQGAGAVSSGIGSVNQLSRKTQADATAAITASDMPADQKALILGELGALTSATGSGSALASGASQLAAGTSTLAAGAPRLAQGVASASSGAQQLSSGASQVASGAASAADGAARLRDGTVSLADGSAELRDSLAQAVADTPETSASGRQTTADAIADPVAVDQRAVTEASNYGAGLAPFFLSLAAWIGIYALFLLVRPLSRRALTATRRPLATALAGWAVPAALGVVQMVGLFLLAVGPLGLQIADPIGTLGFMMLVSITFAAIVLALNVWLGSVGQFLGLLLMVVQLVTAGGTFPWQTLPAPLAVLHQVLPMSSAVTGMRQLMYGGGGAALGGAVGILAIWLVAALAISVAGARKQSGFRTLRELRPSPIAG